jgi:methylmalonyl-CoA mutase cobalamin-binding domain/chain
MSGSGPEVLIATICDGNVTVSIQETDRLLAGGRSREELVRDGVEEAMNRLGAKCTVEHFNLLEVMLAGRAVMEVMKRLYPNGPEPRPGMGPVLLASLEGDVHDLGKGIVKTVLLSKGFRVIDCGKDCPVARIVETAWSESVVAVGVSGLITSVIPLVKRIRPAMAERGLGKVRILAGGAALRMATKELLNVDYVADSAFDGARFIQETIDIEKSATEAAR